jgi:hypothetical protein
MKWLAACLRRCIEGTIPPDAQWIVYWVAGACLDSVEKRKVFLSLVGLELLVSCRSALSPAKIVPGFYS